MKSKKCKIVINTRWGYCLSPISCNSIKEAMDIAHDGMGFAYRIFDEDNNLIRRGFCK